MHTLPVPPGMETELLVVAPGALADVPSALARCFPGKRPWIVADGNTWEAAGKRLQETLDQPHPPLLFPGAPRLHPDSRHAEAIADARPADSVPVAVGSGVINDLVKRGAFLAGTRYLCVPTAASVDGYTSYGAALAQDGFKLTQPCPAPLGVVADVDVMRSAPPDMLAAGYADLLTKIPAGADWILADALAIEPIKAGVWDMVQKELRRWTAVPVDMGNVFAGLAATGFAMQSYRESRPASGAEHLMSHVWEMEGLTLGGEEVSHGFKVGIGLLATTRLFEYLLATDVVDARRRAAPPPTRDQRRGEVDALLVRDCYGADPGRIAMEKFLEGPALSQRREAIWKAWEPVKPALSRQLIPSAEAARMMAQADCPVTPAAIGLEPEQFLHGIRTAQLIRKRYTILDFLYEAGLLEEGIRHLSASTFA